MNVNKSTYISITLVAVVLGFLMAFQFRTTSSIVRAVPDARDQELTIEKKQVERDLNNLSEEVADLLTKLEEAEKGRTKEALESELNKIKLYAGLLPVEGPGVEVTLDNHPESVRPGGNSNFYTIKDDDLLKIVNDLRGAGAEAIAINEERIIATSEVRLAGSHINVNLNRLSPPYKVSAIGNPGNLVSSLEIKGGLVEYFSDSGAIISVQKKEKILVPAYRGSFRIDYAKPTQK